MAPKQGSITSFALSQPIYLEGTSQLLSDAEEVLDLHEATTTIVARSSAAAAIVAILDLLVAESRTGTRRRLTEARRLACFAAVAYDCYCVTSCSSRSISRF